MKKILVLIFILTLISGCTSVDPQTKAQSFISKGNYEKAINILEEELKKDPESVPIKSLLAQTYSDYGLVICQDTKKAPKDKYPLAKTKFQKAVELNPYLDEAKEMVKMIEEIETEFKKSQAITSKEDLANLADPVAKAKAEEALKKENEK